MKWKRIMLENTIDLDNLVLNIVDDELVEEGAGKAIAFGVLAFLLGSSSIVEGAEFKKGILHLVQDKQVENGKVNITQSELKDVIEQSKKKPEMLGKWRKDFALNILARTLYMEARGEGDVGLNMVLTVIWNRAGGKAENLADVCLKPLQFSCWNKITGKTPSTYSIQFPKGAVNGSGKEASSWDVCVNLAKSAIDGTFKPVDSHWNAYYNPNKANPDWASQLIGAEIVGRHKVGELKDVTRTANRLKGNTQTYAVKKGDTLWGISGKDMKKVAKIKELNGLKSDSITPGQVLKIG